MATSNGSIQVIDTEVGSLDSDKMGSADLAEVKARLRAPREKSSQVADNTDIFMQLEALEALEKGSRELWEIMSIQRRLGTQIGEKLDSMIKERASANAMAADSKLRVDDVTAAFFGRVSNSYHSRMSRLIYLNSLRTRLP